MSKNLFSKVFALLLVVGLLFAVAPTGQAQAQTGTITLPGGSITTTSLGGWAQDSLLYGPHFNVDAGPVTVEYLGVNLFPINFTGDFGWPPDATDTGASAIVGLSDGVNTAQYSVKSNLSGSYPRVADPSTFGKGSWNAQTTGHWNDDGYRSYLFQGQFTGNWTQTVGNSQFNAEKHGGPDGTNPDYDTFDIKIVFAKTAENTYSVTGYHKLWLSSAIVEGAYWDWNQAGNAIDPEKRDYVQAFEGTWIAPNIDMSDVQIFMAIQNWATTQPGFHTFDWDGVVVTGSLAEVWVDDTWAGTSAGTIVDGHTFGLDAFATIQEGVAAVGAGGLVNVYDGVYNPPTTITLDKAISIIGPTTGEAKVIGAGGATNKIFNITRSNVTIQRLTLTLAVAPTATDALINATEGTAVGEFPKTNINILDNKIYVDPQAGAMSTWFGQAIYLGRLTTDSKVNGNTIYNLRSGLVVAYQSALEIKDNVIYNTKGGIMNYTGTAEDAAARVITNNSWGTVHNEWDIVWNSGGGPYDLDENALVLGISQSNNDAYVVSQMPTAYTTPPQLIYGNRSHVFVNATTGTETIGNSNGNINLPYAKIQDGINAVVPGGIVYVAAGDYPEAILITKNLTLVGAGATTTHIIAPATLPTYSDNGSLNAVVEIANSNVDISGFTVDGAGKGNDGGKFVGVHFWKNTNPTVTQTGSIKNCVVTGVRDEPLSGAQDGIAILVNHPWDVSYLQDILIESNTIIDYQKGGVVVTEIDAIATITDNIITGAGPVGLGLAAQNGVQIGYGATGSITGNTISNNNYTAPGWSAAGVLVVGSKNVTISDNSLSGNGIAIDLGDDDTYGYGSSTDITVTGNTATDNVTGIRVTGAAATDIVIQTNTISGSGTGIELGDTVTVAPTITGNNVNMAVLQFHDGSTAAVVNMATVFGANTWAPFSIISGRDILVPAPVHNVTKDTYFSTIQAAIDDAETTNGDVIVVRGGLYIENVNVTKEVTLLGARDLVDFSLPVSTTTWYVDRYAPAIFESANVAGEMVLKHGVRAPAQPNSFYNNQGRGYDLGLTGTSQTVSIDLFVDTAWTSGQQNAGLWGVGVDSTPAVSAYPILAWRNVTGFTPGFYTYDYINGGYNLLKAAAAGDYGKWHTLSFTLTPGIGMVYSVDGVTSTFADPYTTNIKSLILNVYNFGVDYDVLWDNLLTSSTTATATIQGQMTINASNVTVDGFTLTNPGAPYGMLVNPGFAHIDITNNIFENIGSTTLADNVKGIYLENGPDDILIEGNTFRDIHAGTKSVNAIYVGDTAATNPTQGLIIRNNSFSNLTSATKGGYGIEINNKAGTEGVLISGNTFDGISGGWTHAIGLEGPTPGTLVTGNTFKNLTATGPDNVAVFFEDNPVGGTVTVEGNKFLNIGYGVAIAGNDLMAYGYNVDASPNWWGSSCGPTPAGANVGPNVTYSPWYTDATMTATSAAATTYNFTPSTGTAAINAAIACAAPGSTFNFATGGYTAGFVVPAGRDHMTLVFADGAVVTATSPCFAVGADFTTIKAANIGMASCVTVAGSNGIDVAANLRNLTVDGFEIYGAGNDGIHYNGVIFDTVLKDNYIHNLAGNGVYFGAQPVALTPGGIDIHGNLFQANTLLGVTNPNGTTPIDATFNSWGDVAGPGGTLGDGVGANVTATPFTHVDVYMVASGTPWTSLPLSQVVSGQTITLTVKAHVVNAEGADIKLLYPSANLSVTSSAVGGVFPSYETLDTSTPGTIWYYGGRGPLAPITGDVTLFTVTFTGATPTLGLLMNLDETSDVFGMEAVGSSSNIYAAALLDSTVNVISLPVIDIVPVIPQPGPYAAGLPIEFNISVNNTGGGNFADLALDFTLPAGAVLQYCSAGIPCTTWTNVTDPMDIGTLAPGGLAFVGPLPLFRVIFLTPPTGVISVALMDLAPATDFQLATTTETFTLAGNFTVTGTFSMQGRSTRAGIPVTLDYQDLVAYADMTGTTINQISYNLVIPNVNGGHWLLTTLQPRYLNVIVANNKIVTVDGNETLIALQLKGGNAIWTDNVIDVNDASEVGSDYGTGTIADNADVNFDGKVNIQDLALVGGNFDLTSETAYGIGNLAIWLVQ